MKFNTKHFIEYKDMYNIYNLITKINAGYRLYFCNIDKKFYIVNIYNNYEICKVFDSFSINIIKELQFSRKENMLKIFTLIEEENEKLYSKEARNKRYKIHDLLQENIKFQKSLE